MGYAYYAAKGYRILAPLVKNDGYDFVAEKDGNFLRVNVKLASLKDKTQSTSWSISQASAGSKIPRKITSPCDIYLAYIPSLNRFIELPGAFLDGGNSKSKRIPKEMYLS